MYLQSFLQKSNLPRSTHQQKELQTRHWKILGFLYLLKSISQQVQLHIPHTASNPWPCAIPPTTSKKHCLHCQELATDALAKEAAQAQAELARLVDAVNGKHAYKIPPLLRHALLQKNSTDRWSECGVRVRVAREWQQRERRRQESW